mmetsp:Transcript_29734/g.100151  ORF Transcript_29734/g.100151 Transcript_29734/m.100151 type:complete len:201 (-) Transcript_29734:676-1278(-)
MATASFDSTAKSVFSSPAPFAKATGHARTAVAPPGAGYHAAGLSPFRLSATAQNSRSFGRIPGIIPGRIPGRIPDASAGFEDASFEDASAEVTASSMASLPRESAAGTRRCLPSAEKVSLRKNAMCLSSSENSATWFAFFFFTASSPGCCASSPAAGCAVASSSFASSSESPAARAGQLRTTVPLRSPARRSLVASFGTG